MPLPSHVPCSEENTPLDLDDHGGRTFLRVLLHLTMHDYPPLVSGALQLLFRHFSQRQEVLQAFKQVVGRPARVCLCACTGMYCMREVWYMHTHVHICVCEHIHV